MKKIAVLGSTGSIGTQTLKVIRENPQKYQVTALSCRKNAGLLAEQVAEFHPLCAAVGDRETARKLSERFPETRFVWGQDGLAEIAAGAEYDILLNALVGMSGLLPTYNAVSEGRTVALANKETLVAGGALICDMLRKTGAQLIPVDSEHSAIFQCMKGYRKDQVERILLTASGGPFRGKTAQELRSVTLVEALNHPRWKMGNKITIDSATLMNKGFEVIEARWLFGLDADRIDVVVHPESIVHSMVEYCDGAVMAQLGVPDMAVPISFALEYPDRLKSDIPRLDLKATGALTFEEPDMETFRCLGLAYEALRAGDTYCTALNAANEVAVQAFLDQKAAFCDIADCLEEVMQRHRPSKDPDIGELMRVDAEARRTAEAILEV